MSAEVTCEVCAHVVHLVGGSHLVFPFTVEKWGSGPYYLCSYDCLIEWAAQEKRLNPREGSSKMHSAETGPISTGDPA